MSSAEHILRVCSQTSILSAIHLARGLAIITLLFLTWQIMTGRRGVSGAPAAPPVAAVRGQGHDGAWTL